MTNDLIFDSLDVKHLNLENSRSPKMKERWEAAVHCRSLMMTDTLMFSSRITATG